MVAVPSASPEVPMVARSSTPPWASPAASAASRPMPRVLPASPTRRVDPASMARGRAGDRRGQGVAPGLRCVLLAAALALEATVAGAQVADTTLWVTP